jgi:hypothetical protein
MSDIKDIWKSQPIEEDVVMNINDLTNHAKSFSDRFGRRNLLLYAYATFNILIHIWALATGRLPAFQAPMVLMLLAHIFVAWQVWLRFTPRRAPLQNSGQAVLQFHRQELQRQHDAVAKAWLWYILPFWLPYLWELAIWFQRIDFARPGSKSSLFALQLAFVGGVCFWSFVWMLFSRHATRMELELERLGRLRAE